MDAILLGVLIDGMTMCVGMFSVLPARARACAWFPRHHTLVNSNP